MKITRIESHHLSDGRLVEISKAGRTYSYLRATGLGWLDAPDCYRGLSKAQAYAMLEADLRENALG